MLARRTTKKVKGVKNFVAEITKSKRKEPGIITYTLIKSPSNIISLLVYPLEKLKKL
jgi:quinol monooxygenase YgiN